jgi:hypothetical protein
LKSRFPQFEIHDLSPILDSLRLIKSKREIEMIRKATKIAGFSETEANKFFGKPDRSVMDGLDIHLRPPTQVRADYTARHNVLLAEME